MSRICYLTNDVEMTSIVNGGQREDTGIKVWKEGLPMLLDLYDRYDVKATFFYIASFAREHPEIVKDVQIRGHEVACHGLTHAHDKAFDILSLDDQVRHLKESKKILEDIAGCEVVSFRSPALRVNRNTPAALKEAGFKFDSSVAPQRLDMFMSLGSREKLQWLGAPRAPYETCDDNLARAFDKKRTGNPSGIIEVPVSSFGLPYIGTFMRLSPVLNSFVRRCLFYETRRQRSSTAINFLIHPNEIITEEDLHLKTERRASNYISYLLSDVLRRRLKQKNLGTEALNLFEKEVSFWKINDYMFKCIKDTSI